MISNIYIYIYIYIYPALQLTRALLRNLDDHLAPSTPTTKSNKRILDAVKTNKLLISVLGAL